MHFGTLIASLNESAGGALERLADSALLAETTAMAAQFDETPSEYLRGAAHRFATQADHEEWMGLMTALERGEDTARAAVSVILRWSLGRDRIGADPNAGCGCGGGGGCHGGG